MNYCVIHPKIKKSRIPLLAKQHPALFYALLFHNLNHHLGSQLKAALEQQALYHGLMLMDSIRITEKVPSALPSWLPEVFPRFW